MTTAEILACREALAESRVQLAETRGVLEQSLIELKAATARVQRVEVALGELLLQRHAPEAGR
jgi:hypothetical protein